MLKHILFGVVVLGVVGLASPAWAAPIINGTVGATEYQAVLNDVAPENTLLFYNTGLDIEALHFDTSSDAGTDWYWLGLTTVAEPIDTDGDGTGRRDKSTFWAIFYPDANPLSAPDYMVEVDMAGGVADVVLSEWSLGAWVAVDLTGAYNATIGNALEVRIDQDKMPNLATNPYVFAQLDGNGSWPDDQLLGTIPEPATLALVGIGLAVMGLRRRR